MEVVEVVDDIVDESMDEVILLEASLGVYLVVY
jgi:hypothetical protein